MLKCKLGALKHRSKKQDDSNNSGSEYNEGNDRLNLHESESNLYTAKVLKTGNLIISSNFSMAGAIEKLSELYSKNRKNWGAAFEETCNLDSLNSQGSLSGNSCKALYEKTSLLQNCKIAKTKFIISIIFFTMSPSIRSTDIKLLVVQ